MNIMFFLGPSRDAQTKEVIWRHKILDEDGIVAPGMLKYRSIVALAYMTSRLRKNLKYAIILFIR